jgi:small-conductance mechanosensitive channel
MAISVEDVVTLFVFIAVLLITIVLSSLLNAALRAILDKRLERSNSKIIARLSQYTVIAIGLYIGIVEIMGLDMGALLASLGILALAITFASQQIIQNTMAGVLIYIQRPIKMDDWVEIGGLPATGIGRVKDITLNRTVLKNVDGRIVYIPNSMLITAKVINYTRAGFTEVPIEIKVPLGVDTDRIREVLKESAMANPRLPPNLDIMEKRSFLKVMEIPGIKQLFDSTPNIDHFVPRLMIKGIDDSKIVLELRVWIREIQSRDDIVSELLEDMLKRLENRGISIS